MNNNIKSWLDDIGLGQYVDVFEANDISLAVLPTLTENDLTGLGVSLGHRKLILQAAQRIGTSDTSPAVETLTADGERRQVTVLYCDLVGSTALSNTLDPEVYRSVLSRYHESAIAAIQRFDGYVQQIQGDGVVAYFGYPIAHEQDAERAIRAGLSIIDTLGKLDVNPALQVRIGIASGLVVASHVLAPNKTAVGETPNLAQRLQTVALPNQVIVSPRTRALAGGSFEFEDHGVHELKGIAAPTQVWRISATSRLQTRFETATRAGITPLVGRDQELGRLVDTWQSSRAGSGQVVLINGEPGIGKSRLLRAFREHFGPNVEVALSYQCSPYYNNTALYPIIDHLERTMGFEREDSAEAKLDKLESRLVTELNCPEQDCNFIARALSIACDERYGQLNMTPQRQKDETLRALVDTVAAIAEQHATVMLMEDVHWIDPTTTEILDQLIERTRTLPLLLLITHRPEFQSHWTQDYVANVALTRLSRAQSATLILKVTNNKPLPADLIGQIVDKTDGVPLFLEELTKAVLESDIVKDSGDRYEYSGKVDQMSIPATLRDSLMARLDRLFPVKELAQIGAVIGREFSHELLEAVSPIKEPKLTEGMDKLVASELIFRRGIAPNATYQFKHALVQDTAYESLLTAKRKELHGQIAETIEKHFPQQAEQEPELVAQHYTKAGNTEQAVPYWAKAGIANMQRSAFVESIAHLDRGLELVNTLSESVIRDVKELELRGLLGSAWMAAAGWTDSHVRPNLERAFDLVMYLQRYETLPSIMVGLWVNINASGRTSEALAIAHRALKIGEEINSRTVSMVGNYLTMIGNFWSGEFTTAQKFYDSMLALYQEAEDGPQLLMLTNHDVGTILGVYSSQWTWMLGFPKQAMAICDAKDIHARQQGHPFDVGFALGFGSFVYSYLRDGAALLDRSNECAEVGHRNNLPFLTEILAVLSRGCALIHAGQTEEGVTILKGYVTSPYSVPTTLPYLKACLAEALTKQGECEEGMKFVNEAVKQIERPGWGERCHYAEILRIKGWILQQQGEYIDAEFNLRASIDFARKQQAKSWELRTSTTLAEILAERGERRQAIELLKPVYDWFTEGFDTYDLK